MSNQQEIIFITGKGGVGKSSIAAGMALSYAQQGKRTLLVELGEHSFYKDYLGNSTVPNLSIQLWSGYGCLRDYISHLIRVDALTRLFFENPVTQTLIRVAPGLSELSIMGKATSHIRGVGPKMDFDFIVIDAYATGHFMSLLRAPKTLAETISHGPMGEQSRHIHKVLTEPSLVRYFVVAIPEELPIQEGMELAKDIQAEVGIKPKYIMNRCWPELPNIGKLNFKSFENIYLEHKKSEKQLDDIKISAVLSHDAWKITEGIAAEMKGQL